MAVIRARTPDARGDAFAVRRRVFIDEQGVDPDLEYDDHDEGATTDHFVAYHDATPIGAARLRPEGSETADGKVERVAIEAAWRGVGWGTRIMDLCHSRAKRRGFRTIALHAQVPVVCFYERLGYTVTSDAPFKEAGIPHVEMRRTVGDQ